jgi:hypothetical protein
MPAQRDALDGRRRDRRLKIAGMLAADIMARAPLRAPLDRAPPA